MIKPDKADKADRLCVIHWFLILFVEYLGIAQTAQNNDFYIE